jgi:putative DNA primase/helicase
VTAAEIAAALGNARREGHDWRCRCPLHGGCSLTLRDGRTALLARCWAGCATREVLAELRRLGLLTARSYSARVATVAPNRDDGPDAARRTGLARRIWDAATDARVGPVARYLAGRGNTIPVPLSLRWAHSLRRPDGARGPAMVARVDGLDGELIAVHRTWLCRDDRGRWHRRDRASLGPVAAGAVRLAPAAETLMIGEGIETCLAAIQATAQPAWAALSTAGMTALLLPPHVRTVIILADHDRSGAGERAARAAGERWVTEGRRVLIAMPPDVGSDFNDVLLRRAYARIETVGGVAA